MAGPEITVNTPSVEVIWQPIFKQELVYAKTKPKSLKQGTLLVRDVETPDQGYHYSEYVQQTAPPSPAWPVGQATAILAKDLELPADTKQWVTVLVAGWVRKDYVKFWHVDGYLDLTPTSYDVDFFQKFGIHLLDTDITYIDDNGAG